MFVFRRAFITHSRVLTHSPAEPSAHGVLYDIYSELTQSRESRMSLETAEHSDGTRLVPRPKSLPSRMSADIILEYFFQETSVVHPIVHQQSFLKAYASLWDHSGQEITKPKARENLVALSLTCLAIGSAEGLRITHERSEESILQDGWGYFLTANGLIMKRVWTNDTTLEDCQCLTLMVCPSPLCSHMKAAVLTFHLELVLVARRCKMGLQALRSCHPRGVWVAAAQKVQLLHFITIRPANATQTVVVII